jgi:hypothetical protein
MFIFKILNFLVKYSIPTNFVMLNGVKHLLSAMQSSIAE